MNIRRDYQICTNCVMDTTDSSIVFDGQGVCDHCNTFLKKILPVWRNGEGREDELNSIITKIKEHSIDSDFDCIMGMSGGIDSSYLLYIMVEKFGLRPLVFHVDAGWNTQIAVNNIEKLVDSLDLDLYTEVINWEEIKDLQLSFFKSGVPHIDVPQDHAFFAMMYKFASNNNINYILTGGNYSTECIRNPIEWMYYQSDSVQLKDIQNKFGTIPLISYPMTSILWHKFYLPYVKGIKTIRPLDYVPYNKEKASNLLVKKFGFQKYPQKHFESRFTRFYESYWLVQRFGFDTRKVQFSSLILSGQMTREQALEELDKPAYSSETINHEIEFVANKLDISTEELMSYMHLRKKTYKDYKSQNLIYNLGAKVLKSLGIEKGGKR